MRVLTLIFLVMAGWAVAHHMFIPAILAAAWAVFTAWAEGEYELQEMEWELKKVRIPVNSALLLEEKQCESNADIC